MRVLIVIDTPERANYFMKRFAQTFNDSRPSANKDNIQVVYWGAPIMGYRADLIILAEGPKDTPREMEAAQHWLETSLRCRLLPQGVIMDFI